MIQTRRDLAYALYISSSLLVAILFRIYKIKLFRKYILSIVGAAHILFFCGFDVYHFIILVGGGCLLIKSPYVTNPKIVFVYSISYRVLFCCSSYLGLPRDESNLANGMMLIATLKVIIVAYEVADLRQKDKGLSKNHAFGILVLEKEPSTMDLVCYMTCFVGIFTGPVFKYRTYSDMCKSTYRPVWNHLYNHCLKLILCGFILALGFQFYNTKYFTSEKFMTDPLILRLLHVYPTGFLYHLRYVSVWLLAESVCICVGLGMYPKESISRPGQGPTAPLENKNKENEVVAAADYDFKTTQNVRTDKLLFEPSFGKSMLFWNCSVQWWLAYFVYQSDIIPKNLKIIRAFSVVLVSSIWHGIKPGFYICFMPLPLMAALDQTCLNTNKVIPGNLGKRLYTMLHWATVKLFCFASFFVAHTLSDYKPMMKFHQGTYFATYIVPLLMTAFCICIRFIFYIPALSKKKL